VLALASKIQYVINPRDEYPRNFAGHLRARMKDGREREVRQPYMRGGARAPLSDEELEAKFIDNAVYGGWTTQKADQLLHFSRHLSGVPKLDVLKEFRG
jgi:hypothetical protein